ncbi:PTS-dependent dihydroxyacetone kinase phosphotransferase subunit DhaM [Curtobacterium flaccumfaciens pv. flaccumfaciens]|uniref:dihydroxyacetone kinase phosphoryl donor subunit DhaM n=1 Tax=Curtobacterium flaccumfaciens TaxID=2035 RepID=UPI001ADA06CF|nr:dihydroxyacetone kinase phosphoryl donor subunit DhaM [Curtobacterium flaccumfaciens]MBO9048607.1 PTS-dependent dihydroxyacetone kinase phosphotransferase subunit DhaM [Curtobacterium flaccumfaciens pv. flaccumfaciens]MBO9056404.1 PTS-dependent dihydroxyacetone kinase phosphotransferase subunit DhaM [Curtobacterium flaccumfaciens pv. flaccumfaciens]QTR89287.1 PTS-dependent dihydroxyacetone kinase phosphotransferase subunit DhaM [Curtobacterium flaccumfaciens pv. flaccumfaciens]QVG64553.1 PTS
MTVGILVVSHSAAIATGTVELARQMAADVPLVAAGGTDDGGIGTSFEAITAGIEQLAQADAVVVLCDLGSAYLTTDTALDFLDDDVRARVHVSQAPLVEGTVAAAVAAQTGGDADAVLAAAASAAGSEADASSASRPSGDQPGGTGPADGAAPVDGAAGSDRVSASVELVNETGLHARPAAEFVKTAAKYDASVHVNGVDAKSLLAIMALALPKGATVSIDATGQDARAAVDALVELVRSGFGE